MLRKADDSIEEQMHGIFTEYKKAHDKADNKVRSLDGSIKEPIEIKDQQEETGKPGGPQRRGRSP